MPTIADEADRSAYVGNFPTYWKTSDMEEYFDKKVGDVERVDLKDKFAFVIFKNAAACDDAIRDLHGAEAGGSEPLRVERSRADKEKRRKEERGSRPSEVLFLANFDKDDTTQEDVERFFEGFDVDNIDMWQGGKGIRNRNYCFVQMKSVDAAVEAQRALDGKTIHGREVSVEFKQGQRGGKGQRPRDDRDNNRSGFGPRYGGGGGGGGAYGAMPPRRSPDRGFGRQEERRDDRGYDRNPRDNRDYGRQDDRNRGYGRQDDRDRGYGRQDDRDRAPPRHDDRGFGRQDDRGFARQDDRRDDRAFGRQDDRDRAPPRHDDRGFGRQDDRGFARQDDRRDDRGSGRTLDDRVRDYGREQDDRRGGPRDNRGGFVGRDSRY